MDPMALHRRVRRFFLRLATLVVLLVWAVFCGMAVFRAYGSTGLQVLMVLSAMLGLLAGDLVVDRRRR